MRFPLVLILMLIIISTVMLNDQSCTLAQSSNEGPGKDQIDNNAGLRELMNELQNTVTTLRKERQAYYSRKQEKDEEVQDLRIQIQSLRETHEDLISEVEDIEREMDALNNEERKFKSSILSYQKKEDELSNYVLSHVRLLREQVSSGIPFQLEERTAKLDVISKVFLHKSPWILQRRVINYGVSARKNCAWMLQARYTGTIYALQTAESRMRNLHGWGGLSSHL